MSRARLVVATAIAAMITGVAIAGSAIAGGEDGEKRRTLEVTLDEWSVRPDGDEVAAGPVTVVQRNTGRVEHQLVIVRTDTPADRIPKGLSGPAPQLAGEVVLGELHDDHHAPGAHDHHLQPGDVTRERVRLEPGRYVLLCTLPGHYEAGQHATLEVRG